MNENSPRRSQDLNSPYRNTVEEKKKKKMESNHTERIAGWWQSRNIPRRLERKKSRGFQYRCQAQYQPRPSPQGHYHCCGPPGRETLLWPPREGATVVWPWDQGYKVLYPQSPWALDPRAWLVGPSIRSHGPDPNLPLLRVHMQAFLAAEPLPRRARQHLTARAALSRAPALGLAVLLLRGHQHAGHQRCCDCRAPASHTWC